MGQPSDEQFEFAKVEEALAGVNNIRASERIAFRGRINNFKRLGVVKSSGGRGKRLIYSIEETFILGICLELSKAGVDPSRIAKMVSFSRSRLIQDFKRIGDLGKNRDVFAIYQPRLIGGEEWDKDNSDHWLKLWTVDSSKCASKEEIEYWIGKTSVVVNLAALKRAIDGALTGATQPE